MNKTNKSVTRAGLIAVLILGSSAWLSAQYTPGQGTGSGDTGMSGGKNSQIDKSDRQTRSEAASIQTSSGQPMKINKASSLIGTTVKNQQGEDLGKIHDLVIDFNADKVAYVVLSTGSGVFSSQKLHAVPLRAFQPSADGTSLTLNADKDKLARDEGFDKNNWPALGATTFGAEPFWNDQGSTGSQPDMNQSERDQQKDQQKNQQKDQNLDSGGHGTERGSQAPSGAHPQQGSGPGGTQPE